MYVLGEDVQWSLFDGEVSSSWGHLISKENRLQQACNAIYILYPLKHMPFSLHVSLWTSLSWKTYPSLFDPSENVFVNLIKLFRWVEGQWKDDVSLSHSTLLLHTGVAGAACSWWWGKTQPHSARSGLQTCDRSCLFFFFLITQPTSGWRTVRSCCPPPITPPALISHYKPPSGYATSESQTSTSSLRFGCL